MITAQDLAARMAGLEEIGVAPDGTMRLAWTPEAGALRTWFAEQAAGLGLEFEEDPAGNLWAVPRDPAPWWGVGSHLDSVRGGGRYDGPLGVAAGFEVAAHAFSAARGALPRRRGGRPLQHADLRQPGSRRAPRLRRGAGAAGRGGDLARRGDGRGRRRSGRAGARPRVARPAARISRAAHRQTRELADAGHALGVVSSLASRARLQLDLHGRADHAGTTRRDERRDAMSAAARLIVDAEALAEPTPGFVVTAARVLVEPNALTTVPSHVRVWLDARVPDSGVLDGWCRALEARAAELAEQRGVAIEVRTASRSAGIAFDPAVRAALSQAAGERAPEVVCFAGHDAGVLAERIPAGMIFVRNASGISHSPDEHVELADSAAAASVLLRALEQLAG
jgi:N-carbamoyl-L-amino-acid hydrolase